METIDAVGQVAMVCHEANRELPLDQRRKDYIFAAICKAFVMSAEQIAV